jgi:hypothetical protein
VRRFTLPSRETQQEPEPAACLVHDRQKRDSRRNDVAAEPVVTTDIQIQLERCWHHSTPALRVHPHATTHGTSRPSLTAAGKKFSASVADKSPHRHREATGHQLPSSAFRAMSFSLPL